MENKQPSVYVPAREIGIITGEIKELCRQARVMLLSYAIEIGRRLCEAKSVLPHGEWGRYLKEEVEFSQSTANNYMKLFEEYGAEQMTLFGAMANSQTLANLPYSKALKLLALPETEREEFAEEVGADRLSVRQLEEAIRERDEKLRAADARAEKAEAEVVAAKADAEQARSSVAQEVASAVAEAEKRMADDLEAAQQAVDAAKAEAKAKAEDADRINAKCFERDREVKRLGEEADKLRAELSKAKKNPKIPKKKLEELKAEAEAAVRAESEAKAQAALDELKAQKDEADKKRAEADEAARLATERLEAAQKALRVANPAVVEFKAVFETLQDVAGKAKAKLEVVRKENPEVADKLGMALKKFGEGLV